MTEITQILSKIEAGDLLASAELLPIVYEELRKLAKVRMASERSDHTLQSAALVHEAFLRLVDANQGKQWANPSYRDVCTRMLKNFADSIPSDEAYFTVWTCALAADAIEDYAPAIQLARHAVKTKPGNQMYLNALGAILLRSGQSDKAKIELEKALAADAYELSSPCYIRYFLAMAERQLGNAQAAHEQLEIANKAADDELARSPPWNRNLTLKLLRDEAEMLIGKTAGK